MQLELLRLSHKEKTKNPLFKSAPKPNNSFIPKNIYRAERCKYQKKFFPKYAQYDSML